MNLKACPCRILVTMQHHFTGPSTDRQTSSGPSADRHTLSSIVQAGRGDVLFFGLTPPRRDLDPPRVKAAAAKTLGRLASMEIDGLVLYDINDESDRTDAPRPFPYLPTMDPDEYHRQQLEAFDRPAVVYRSVGKYEEDQLRSWLRARPEGSITVFVGASSSDVQVKTSLVRALEIRREIRPDLLLGGVAIPERHALRGDEHLRLLDKQAAGCSFFVSQVVYNLSTAKDMVSEYFYSCADRGLTPAPIIFTLSLCGSEQTLAFLQWLGVNVPAWVQNELRRGGDTLETSLGHCNYVAEELTEYCRHLGIPFGFNVESVSNRRAEIDAAVALTGRVSKILGR